MISTQPHTTTHDDLRLPSRLVDHLIEQHLRDALPRFDRLWCYYRNALAEPRENGGSTGPPAQVVGLPKRLRNPDGARDDERLHRELVIENDIGWRIHTLVDFMFPESPRITSQADDPALRDTIDAVLARIIEHSGGIALWQNAALLGSVYGHVDLLIHTDALATLSTPSHHNPTSSTTSAIDTPTAGRTRDVPSGPSHNTTSLADRIGSLVSIETVEAPRAIALVDPDDYRAADAFIVHYRQPLHDVTQDSMLQRIGRRLALRHIQPLMQRASRDVTEIHTARVTQRYHDGVLVHECVNRIGRVPLVHIQNLPQPLVWEGLSDVEPLIPLQDELNTRLSDRANRVTMQSFRMWLGKGIDSFIDRPVGPGQMWMTDNTDASVEAFGGDADSPSEEAHLSDLREALDKASGVTPAAAGHIKAKIGNLTSENALRISLMGTIAKVKRKRVTYGHGIAQACEMILHALDVYGLVRTSPADRRVNIVWADPLPPDRTRTLEDAQLKAQLGVPLEQLRGELGYE